jgi:V8-like Glu-specific endopeptidase
VTFALPCRRVIAPECAGRLRVMNARGRGAHRALAISALPLATAIALVSSLAVGVTAAAAAPSGVTVESPAAQQVGQFWTAARMQRAKPMDVTQPRRIAVPSAVSAAAEEVAHRIAPTAPRSGATASSKFDEVGDPASEAARQNGVIFFTAEGGLARCSGTSVNAPNFSVVFTAGHCVNSGGPHGTWYRGQWAFVPGYRYGQRPFGIFPAKWIDSTRGWLNTGSENFDVGAAVVMRNERGQRLADAVGGAGIAWGQPADQVFDVHGYPVAPPFDGETQRLCAQTPFLGHDAESFLSRGPLNLAVDCDVTGGASGGGWTIDGDILNGVTDYGYGDDAATDFGAYFGKEVAHLYGRAGKIK